MNKNQNNENDEYIILAKKMLHKFGQSNDEDRQKIVAAFGGFKNMSKMAKMWLLHHIDETTFVLFATAIDLGYRIGKKGR